MNLSHHQRQFLAAIDSKDFANVAEYLLDNGPVQFPGIMFYFHGDKVVIEHANKRREQSLYQLVAAFTARHGIRLVEDRTTRPRRVPQKPQFIIRHNPAIGVS